MQVEVVGYAYDYFEQEDPIDGSTSINAWCLLKDSTPALVRYIGFQPFCYVELPNYIDRARHKWNSDDAILVNKKIIDRLGDKAPLDYKAGMYATLYRGGVNYPMLRLEFKNRNDINACEILLRKPLFVPDLGEVVCNVWSHKISTVRQLLTNRKCKYSQWFKAKCIKVHPVDKISTLEHEYTCDYNNMDPIPNTITKSWSAMPHVLTFDIEVYSDNHKAMPIRTIDSHVAYMCSCIYQQINNKSSRVRYLIIMGDCTKLEEDVKDARNKGEVIVVRVSNEYELCEVLTDIIHKHDPEVLSGYNILGFDYPYLNARLERLVKSWNVKASRLIGVKPELIIPRKWESKAYGHNENYFINFPGRISVDMLPIIRRGHKLPKYDLDTVGNAFLKKGKHDVKPVQMFEYYEEFMKAKKLYERCIEDWIKVDSNEIVELFDKFTNASSGCSPIAASDEELMDFYTVLTKESNVTETSSDKMLPKFHENISITVLTEIVNRYHEAKRKLSLVGLYCVQDSELVVDLIDKTYMWIGLVELSNIVGISIVDTYSRGQQIRGLSQAFNLLESKNPPVVIDYKPPIGDGKFSGGFVAQPIVGIHDFVITLDFKSLYPSILMAYNICMNTYLYPGDEKLLTKGVDYEEVPCPIYDEEDDDKIIGYNIHRFLKKDKREGYIPQLVRELVNGRSEVRAQMKGLDEDSLEWKVLNERQLALKVSANSVYGMLGVKKGALLPFLQGAESVTAIGREKILFCNKYLEDNYKAKIIYNDTDSTMFVLPFVKTYQEAIEWGFKLAKELSKLMPQPMELEMEKVGRMLCIKKKKYAYWPVDIYEKVLNKVTKKYEPNPHYGEFKDYHDDPNNILVRGIVLARRDNCRLLRNTYRNMMESVLDRKNSKDVLSGFMKQCIKLYWGDVDDISELVIIRSLGSNYKSETYFMKMFGEEIKKLGRPASPGDRLEYIICEGDGLLGQRLRLPEVYYERMNTPQEDKIDYRYYLEKLFIKSLEQLWSVGYRHELDVLEKKYDQEDKLAIISNMYTLCKKDKGAGILQLWNHFYGNVDNICAWLSDDKHEKYVGNEAFHKYMHNKYVKSRQEKVSGRAVFHSRITKFPIRQLLKSIDMNRLEEYAKVVLTSEDYKELFESC